MAEIGELYVRPENRQIIRDYFSGHYASFITITHSFIKAEFVVRHKLKYLNTLIKL